MWVFLNWHLTYWLAYMSLLNNILPKLLVIRLTSMFSIPSGETCFYIRGIVNTSSFQMMLGCIITSSARYLGSITILCFGDWVPRAWSWFIKLSYCWWFRNPIPNHRLDVWNPVNNGINYHINWCRICSINSIASFCSFSGGYKTEKSTGLVNIGSYYLQNREVLSGWWALIFTNKKTYSICCTFPPRTFPPKTNDPTIISVNAQGWQGAPEMG